MQKDLQDVIPRHGRGNFDLATEADAFLLTLSRQPSFEDKLRPAESQSQNIRLVRLVEINAEQHQAWRPALAQVFASLNLGSSMRLLYLLEGKDDGSVGLYLGVASIGAVGSDHIDDALRQLQGALQGQLPGTRFGESISREDCEKICTNWQEQTHCALMLGTPTLPEPGRGTEEEGNAQGLDRMVRSLLAIPNMTGGWHVAVVSQRLDMEHIQTLLEDADAISSQLMLRARTTVQGSINSGSQDSQTEGTNVGHTRNKGESASKTSNHGYEGSSRSRSRSQNTSESSQWGCNTSRTTGRSQGANIGITQELDDKRAQRLLKQVDEQLIARLQQGLGGGLFASAVYLSASNKLLFDSLKGAVRATFQGSQSTGSPLRLYELSKPAGKPCFELPAAAGALPAAQQLLCYSLHALEGKRIGSLLTASELTALAGLPQREIKGVRRRRAVEFAVDVPTPKEGDKIMLGSVMDSGQIVPGENNKIALSRSDLNKHIFITGTTGAGKTTTCLNLLRASGLGFLVIEPAKTEYRELVHHGNSDEIRYYRPNDDAYNSLRLNPLALLRDGQRINSHVAFVKNALTAAFDMEASMPQMVEAAIMEAYEEKGWDLDSNEFTPGGNPFDPSTRAWPTLSDVIRRLDEIIPRYKLGKEFEEKYRGSLVSRLRGITAGPLGRILDVPQSMDFMRLLAPGQKAVIELENLQSGEEKALFMGLLLGCVREVVREQHKRDSHYRHIIVVEEAHRLLSRPEPGDKAAALATQSFADMLAEVRKYGACMVIADQIPGKLLPDVIKNTNTKIVHRLLPEDDRRAMGESMMMDEKQRAFLPELAPGEAIVFCGGWHGCTHVKIDERLRTDREQGDEVERLLPEKSVRQLWDERHRYWPLLCTLDWLPGVASQNAPYDRDAAQKLADFISKVQSACKHILRLRSEDGETAKRAFAGLKKWLANWQGEAESAQSRYAKWRSEAERAAEWPEDLLAAALTAFMLDANPLPQPDVKSPVPLKRQELEFIACQNQTLLRMVTESESIAALREGFGQVKSRNLTEHLAHIEQYIRF